MKTYSLDKLDELISDLKDIEKNLNKKVDEIVQRLAEIGVQNAQVSFDSAYYVGDKDATVRCEQRGPGRYAVIADGQAVLFIEFGAGVKYSDPQHPEAAVNGMGVGTYPEQTHAFDPKGWNFWDGTQWRHSYGNAPSMPMYNAVKELEQQLTKIVTEVLLK